MRRDVELGRPSFIDVLDRVLDKGIVIDGWGRVAVAGIDLINFDAWVVVASIHTYLQYADSLGLSPRVPSSVPLDEVPLQEMSLGRI
jgi:gas vesicle structural protein